MRKNDLTLSGARYCVTRTIEVVTLVAAEVVGRAVLRVLAWVDDKSMRGE